jgi:hypothetical protein
MTQAHSLDSLCTFIANARNIDKLEAQIKQKEGLLKNLEQLETIYEDLGSQVMLDRTTEEYNVVFTELLVLKLKKNKLEREMLVFQLKSFLED